MYIQKKGADGPVVYGAAIHLQSYLPFAFDDPIKDRAFEFQIRLIYIPLLQHSTRDWLEKSVFDNLRLFGLYFIMNWYIVILVKYCSERLGDMGWHTVSSKYVVLFGVSFETLGL